MGRCGGSGGGKSRSYSTVPRFGSSPFFRKKSSSPAKDDHKDKKASPPAKAETTHVESRPGGFFSSIADDSLKPFLVLEPLKQRLPYQRKVEVATVSANEDNDKHKDYTESCSISYNAFQECLNVGGNNLRKCHIFMDSLFECRKNSSSFHF